MDLSLIQHKLIGISFLDQRETERVKSVWEERFGANDAFFVEAQPQDNASSLARKLFDQMMAQGFEDMHGISFVTAMFYDLADGRALDMAKGVNLGEFNSQITKTGGTISQTMQFGYLGRQPYEDPEKLRQHAGEILDMHKNLKLCLVAAGALAREGGNNWKAVVFYLDILRRSTDHTAMIPAAGYRVGFLKYGEYDHERLTDLQERLDRIRKQLGDEGDQELSRCLDQSLSQIYQEAAVRFPVSANSMPMHPDVVVTGWIDQHKAVRGKNKKFNNARESLLTALDLTGKHLGCQIQNMYQMDAPTAKKELIRLIESSGMSIGAVLQDGRLKKILNKKLDPVPGLLLPSLDYNQEQKYTREINDYLVMARENGVHKAQANRLESLKGVCEDVRSYYEQRRQECQREQDVLSHRLKNILNRDNFLQMCANVGDKMECCFSPAAAHGSTCKMVVYRAKKDEERTKAICGFYAHYLDEVTGGLKTVDAYEIKAVQAAFFDYNDSLLLNLIN